MISIIVPTYKRIDKLKRCLESISGSVGNYRFEIIVIDDCPEGSAFETAKAVGARYFYKNRIDKGQSVSRNIGIKLSRGNWLCFLDDDDFLEVLGLSNLLDNSIGDADILYGDYYLFDENIDHLTLRDNSQMTVDEFLVRNRMALGSFLISKAKIKKYFDEQMKSHEDWDFLMPYVVQGYIKYINTKVAYIDKTDNLTTATTSGRRKDYFWLDYLSIYAKYPADHLKEKRLAMLRMLGIEIPSELVFINEK